MFPVQLLNLLWNMYVLSHNYLRLPSDESSFNNGIFAQNIVICQNVFGGNSTGLINIQIYHVFEVPG